MPLIECIPNISEGRRVEVLEDFARSIRAVPDVRLLDVSCDGSHNRSVFTLCGPETALEEAVLDLFACVIPVVDLRAHQGVHPRLGAIDVVPFVPLVGASMDACVGLARRVGAAVGSRFEIPVFLYEEAASDRARARLEVIRKGGVAAMSARIGRSGWVPDFGPSTPHPTAGVTAVGARRILVAFNVNLDSADLGAARRIAATIREANGGLPAVKALGLSLDRRGIVQVSMNLTDYQQTPLPRAFAAVCREADALGVRVLESEIVGLAPRAAFAGVSPEALKLAPSPRSPILEDRLAETTS
ncbi:MAG TPA: glutamate formimidoyltransferase [Vicinamibacterales bacterium]|jgi:glutamate formiminotransferase|nr:glutamate formimidoyltransferase [Vicinamibacterales bacterium]